MSDSLVVKVLSGWLSMVTSKKQFIYRDGVRMILRIVT
jgi:hypothetical protein